MGVELIPKDTLGLAAEFAVASELCRRGIYAQLTLGNRKRTDLLVDVENGQMFRLQVKAKQKQAWPGVKGVSGPSIVLVLVDYEKKELVERPDFYVLTPSDWKAFINVQLVKPGKVKDGKVSLNEDLVPTFKDGWVGMSVRPEQVRKYRERWEKIIKAVKRAP